MKINHTYKIFPLGDSALTVDFGNIIDEKINKYVMAVYYEMQKNLPNGVIEIVPAYSSLSFYYSVSELKKSNPGKLTAHSQVKEIVERFLEKDFVITDKTERIIKVPVCYDVEFGTDLLEMSQQKDLSIEEIIKIHFNIPYRVYMLGFLPGFSYMGIVDERIATERKPLPKRVLAGSVAIAGNQTGIYPFESPGGWNVIGRTPLNLFDKEKANPTLFQPCDKIQFYPITKNEFENY